MDMISAIISIVAKIENPKTLVKVYAAVKRITECERKRTKRGKRMLAEDRMYDE